MNVSEIIARTAKIEKDIDKIVGDNVNMVLSKIDYAKTIALNKTGNTKREVYRKLQEVQEWIDQYKLTAQSKLDHYIGTANEWMSKQVKYIQQKYKEQEAKEIASAQECASGNEIPDKAVEELTNNIPDIDIPTPSLPSMKIPWPSVDIIGIADELMNAATGTIDQNASYVNNKAQSNIDQADALLGRF